MRLLSALQERVQPRIRALVAFPACEAPQALVASKVEKRAPEWVMQCGSKAPGLVPSLGLRSHKIFFQEGWVSLYLCVWRLYNVFIPVIPSEPENHH